MELYDKGEEKAWLELFRVFAGEKEDVIPGNIGILGMTPQDISDLRAADRIRGHFAADLLFSPSCASTHGNPFR